MNPNNDPPVDTPNNISSIEYIDAVVKNQSQPNLLLSFSSLIAFMGGRHIISDFYDHRPDILCNPLVKILILLSMLYMNIKNTKITIFLFFVYIFFIDNYIENSCSTEYLDSTKHTKTT